MKLHYNNKYTPLRFSTYIYLRLTKKADQGYHLANHTKLFFTRVGLFKIIRPYNKLAYELDLPHWLTGIHLVISVEHLDPADPDLYYHKVLPPGPIHVDGEERYIINDIIGSELCKVPG
jgi:hypothetical protein